MFMRKSLFDQKIYTANSQDHLEVSTERLFEIYWVQQQVFDTTLLICSFFFILFIAPLLDIVRGRTGGDAKLIEPVS